MHADYIYIYIYRKKHLLKEAIRKIVYKQTMWGVYRRTRKDEDYTNYKEALNAATTEIRTSKRSCDHVTSKMTARVFMHMSQSGVNKTYETKLDH